jgi:hypothetical protein
VHVSIEYQVFDQCGLGELPAIMKLMSGFSQGRHDWVELNPKNLECAEQYFLTHTTSYAPIATELARKGSVAALAWSASPGIHVEVRRDQLEPAVEDLDRPAELVVENSIADGGFIRAICRAFGDQRILNALEKQWLEIISGGGSMTAVVAQERAAKFRLHVRVVTLLDSDSLYPQHRTTNHDKADALQQCSIQTHVLTLREVENYIPNCLLAALGKPQATTKRLFEFRKLSLAQRGYFDMKSGFTKDEQSRKVIPPQRQELYASLPADVRRAIHEGFGQDVIAKAVSYAARLTEQDFDKLGVAVELRKLLATINTVI